VNHQDTKAPRKTDSIGVEVDAVARAIVDSAYRIHKTLGPGLLESAYESCFHIELSRRGLPFQSQLRLPITYEGIVVEPAYRLDLVVDNAVIVEIKATEKLMPVHEAQLLTYLKLTGLRVGLLINFNASLIKDGIKRFVL